MGLNCFIFFVVQYIRKTRWMWYNLGVSVISKICTNVSTAKMGECEGRRHTCLTSSYALFNLLLFITVGPGHWARKVFGLTKYSSHVLGRDAEQLSSVSNEKQNQTTHVGEMQAKVNEAFHPIYEAYESVAVYGNCHFTRKVLPGFSVGTATSESIRRGIWGIQ